MGFWYRISRALSHWYFLLFHSYKVVNREGLTRVEEGLLIASNHVSFFDPPLVGVAYRKAIYFFARKTLFEHPIAKFLLPRINAIPVDQDRPELSTLKKIIQLLKDGEKVVIFPEGERSWDGKIKEAAQPGIGMIVSKARVPVLPVRIFGAEKALPRGAKRPTRCPITVVVGEPIDLSPVLDDPELGTKEKYAKISSEIIQAIAALRLPGDEKKTEASSE